MQGTTLNRIRRRLGQVVDGTDPRWSRPFDVTVLVLIVVSIASLTVETLPGLSQAAVQVCRIIEIVTVAAFSCEYVLRLYVARPVWRYSLSPMGVIDLLAILPSLLALGFDLRSLRAIRLLRVFRLLKIARYTNAIRVYRQAFRMAREEIVLFLVASMILLYLTAAGIYYFESEAQPDAFSSIPHALWWAVATLTTVGYGDVYPLTLGGRIFTFFVLVLGLGVVAVPSGLLAGSLSQARKLVAENADGEREE